MLKAVLFDLDGTLLPLDTQEFMQVYLKEISSAVAHITDPVRFVQSLLTSTHMMLQNRDAAKTNTEVFWADFSVRLGGSIDQVMPVIEDFYATRFGTLSWAARPSGHARIAVETALSRGLRVALATNPVFPLPAVRERMAWASVADLPWDLITSYENMHFCKPHLEYYQEILDQLKLRPEECLMVGNDTDEDMVAGKLGLRTCLVTDYLIGNGLIDGVRPEWSGELEKLSGWLARLEP